MAIGIDGYVIGTGDDVYSFGPEAGVDLCAAGEDGDGVGLPAIQTQTFNLHLTALDAITIQIAPTQYWCTSGEGGLGRIDKTAAVTRDTRRVGGDDLGAVAGDFDPAVELTGIGAVDFIQDHAGTARGEPGITLHPTTELGLCVGAAVVENRTVSIDVELAVAVTRDTSSTGGLDVD